MAFTKHKSLGDGKRFVVLAGILRKNALLSSRSLMMDKFLFLVLMLLVVLIGIGSQWLVY
jgi:hypothetical protein